MSSFAQTVPSPTPSTLSQDSLRTAHHALQTLRPLIQLSTLPRISKVFKDFADKLGAAHHAFGVWERKPEGPFIRWQFEDIPHWWEGFREEFQPLMAEGWGKNQVRASRCATDDPTKRSVHIELYAMGAYSTVCLVAETPEPSGIVAAMTLQFKRRTALSRAESFSLLGSLCEHAASLVLDAYLRVPNPVATPIHLSPREVECLRWTAVGKTSWETSCILGVRERTVNFHLGNVFDKLKVSNKQAAIANAILQGLMY